MVIDLNPVVASVGPLAVRWFGLLGLVGFGLAIWLSLRELARRRLSRAVALDALAWGLPAGLLTAWVVHVLGYWDYYLTNSSELWQVGPDALSLWGGLVGGGLVAAARLRGDAERRRRILDAIVPYVALGIAVGRLGEFLDGHGQGVASALPWATQYANPLAASPDFGVSRQPAQVYDALAAVALFALLKVVPDRMPTGTRLAIFLVVYGLERVIIGQVRLDPSFLFGLQIEQLLALGCVVVGAVYGLRAVVSGSRRRGAGGSRLGKPTAAQARAQEDTLAA